MSTAVGSTQLVRLAFRNGDAADLPSTGETGEPFFSTDTNEFHVYNGSRMVKIGNTITDSIITSTSTVENTTTETTIFTATNPADSLLEGQVQHISLLGKFSTSSASDFFTLRLKTAGTTVLSGALTAKNTTDDHFKIDFYLTTRTTGATGTYAAHLEATLGDEVLSVTPVTGNIDTTVAEDITATIQWDAADVGNVFELIQGYRQLAC